MSGQCKRRPIAKSNPARTTQVRLQLLTCTILKYHRRKRGGEGRGQRGENRDDTAESGSSEGSKAEIECDEFEKHIALQHFVLFSSSRIYT